MLLNDISNHKHLFILINYIFNNLDIVINIILNNILYASK